MKNDVTPIDQLEPKNQKRINRLISEIKEHLEMESTGDTTTIKPDPFPDNNSQKAKDINYLARLGIVTKAKYIEEQDYRDCGFEITVNRKRLFSTIEEIKDTNNEPTDNKTDGSILHYDIAQSTFSYGESNEILKKDSNEERLCRAMFENNKDQNKIWEWEDVLMEWDYFTENDIEEATNKNRDTVYTAARAVNKKIDRLTKGQISKLFKSGKYRVSIDPKYLTQLSIK